MSQDYTRFEDGGTENKGGRVEANYQTVSGIVGLKYTIAERIDLGVEIQL